MNLKILMKKTSGNSMVFLILMILKLKLNSWYRVNQLVPTIFLRLFELIVDLKTSAYKPDPKDVNMNLQMTAYSYAYHHITGEFPKLRMDHLIKTKTPRLERVKTSRNSLAFRKLFLLTKEVLNGIKSRIFFPNPSWRCGDCEYRQVCWMFNGISKQT